MDNSTIICDEATKLFDKEIKAIPTNFSEKKVTCKTQSFYILLAFLLITISLLIAGSIDCYLVKHRAKNLLPYHDTKNNSVLIL